MSHQVIDEGIRSRLRDALLEDIGEGDLTTVATVPAGMQAAGRVTAKAPGVFCGFAVFEAVYQLLDDQLTFALGRDLVLDVLLPVFREYPNFRMKKVKDCSFSWSGRSWIR